MLKRIRELFGRRDRDGNPGTAASTDSRRGDEPTGDGPGDAASVPAVHHGPKVVHHPIPEKDLDSDAVKIVRRLTRFDHIAYLVGGCVRDLLLDRAPKDFDIATSATPRQVKRAFRNCRIVGRRFRLAHVYFHDGKIIEVATFRAQEDGNGNGDGAGDEDDAEDLMIRDDNVFGTPEEDALRRDFTINQLFYDVNAETVLDHAGGLDDLRRRVVRTIGNPEIRFREDPIRILRAIKFAARLDLDIERSTRAALEATRSEIQRAAPPRILEEINRFCRGGAAVRSFELLRETDVLDAVLPEFHDAYGQDGPAWSLLRGFLARFDAAAAKGHEPSTGVIFAALLLPRIAERLGWNGREGRAERPRGLDVRRLIESEFKPAALRLRVSRKDQEQVRQIVMALQRMVPADNVRAGTRRSILARPCIHDALALLGVLGETYGGAFAEAFSFWKQAADDPDARVGTGRRAGTDDRDADGDGTRRKRRRRRRGGGASKGADDDDKAARDEAPEERKQDRRPESGRRSRRGRGSRSRDDAGPSSARKPDPNLPPVWDDRYFFAALPTVPDGIEAPPSRDADPEADDAPAGADGEPQATTDGNGSDPAERPRRRRRRRRGGTRRKKKSPADAAPDGGDEG